MEVIGMRLGSGLHEEGSEKNKMKMVIDIRISNERLCFLIECSADADR
jgi:hypothetical protein